MFNVGDKVKINRQATIEDFTKDHWEGCQIDTLNFIRDYGDMNKEFIVEESYDKYVRLRGKYVNKNIIQLVEKVKKEMTISEIEKELGYSIKIVKD